MERRKFLSLGAIATAAAVVTPSTLSAVDFRNTKPGAWAGDSSHDVMDAMEALYGTSETIEKGVDVKTVKIASNGGAIPVTIRSKIDAESVALFQDANPESLVAVWTVPENGIIDYSLKIKMKRSGEMTVVVKGKDGKLYSSTKALEVALGGCEG